MSPTSSKSSPVDGGPPTREVRKTYRIFLSSPADVQAERDAVERVVARINAELYQDATFELIRWEDRYYTADRTFQDQIARPADCDVVVCIFWKRLGSDLPDRYRAPDGSLPTGTEYEFEQAVQQAAASPDKVPDVLVYRKTAEVQFSEANLAVEKAQRDRFLAFWQRWFRNEKGQFVAGFHSFADAPEFEAMVEGHVRQWLKDRAEGVTWTSGSPFRGLKPFDVEHASVFFGRRRETERARARFLANALAGARFLLISGPSGSGKSSLVRAGLIPRLRASGGIGGLPRLTRRAVVTPTALTDGEKVEWPLGLARALFSKEALGAELEAGDFTTPERLAAMLAVDGPAAAAPIARALERAASGPGQEGPCGLILVIDQLEEIFTWAGETWAGEAANAFAACLARLSAAAHVYLIATMRSEFQHRLDEIPALAALAAVREVRGPDESPRILDVGIPSAADIRDMIAGPALAAGLVFAPAEDDKADLQTRIERDSSPEALPALQFLLTKLYEQRDGQTLTHAAYDALGGVAGVLASRGQKVLTDLGDELGAAAVATAFPNLVRSLVRVGDGKTPAVARPIGTALFVPNSAEARLVAALRDAGLLVADRRTIRLAHESLIAGWDTLGAVVAEERRLFEARERVVSEYRRYQEIDPADRAARRRNLLGGLSLAEGRDLLSRWGRLLLSDPYPDLPDFIIASDRADRRRRVFTLGLIGATSATFALIAVAALWSWTSSVQSAKDAQVRLQIARAEAALRLKDWDRALDEAARAAALQDTPDTRSIALTALMEHSSPQLARRLPGPAAAARFAADGTLVTLSPDGVLTFAATPRRELRFATPDDRDSRFIDFALLPDGGVVVLTSDGRAGFVDAPGAQATSAAVQPRWETAAGYFLGQTGNADIHVAPAQVRVAMVNGSLDPGRLLTCSLKPARECRASDLPAESRVVAFAPDGRHLALAADGSVQVLDLDAPAAGPRTLALQGGGAGSVQSIGWSSDGSTLVLGTRSGEAVAVGPSRGPEPLAIKGRTAVSSLPMAVQTGAPAGSLVASSCDQGFVCLINLDASGAPHGPSRLFHLPSELRRLSWSADGQQLVTVLADHQLRVWTMRPQHPVLASLSSVGVPLRAMAVDRQSGRIAAGDADGRVWIWSGGSASGPPRQAAKNPGQVDHLAFAPDGALAALYNDGKLVRIAKDPASPSQSIAVRSDSHRVAWLQDGRIAVSSPREVALVSADGSLSRADIGGLKPGQTIGSVLGLPGDGGLVLSLSDGALLRSQPGGPAQPLLPAADSKDSRSALDLALDPSGRWLVATRADDQVRIYDLNGRAPPLALALVSRDSKRVAFAPKGNLFAALASDDRLYVWRFDASAGRAEPFATVFAVPTAYQAKLEQGTPRQAQWMDWLDDTHLSIATWAGTVLVLSLDRNEWTSRLDALTR